jgi:hypothetical protein
VLQGRLDAVRATNATLQQQLAARHEAESPGARPVRAEAAPERFTAARPVVNRPERKAASAPVTPGKTAVRHKQGRTDG